MTYFEIPNVVMDINKKAKTNKIVPLSEAEAKTLQRMFSGSIVIDYLTGGGYGYARQHLLYGAKSSGKNASLNQLMAFNQRLCRNCHGIRQDFYSSPQLDYWTSFLKEIMLFPECQCDAPSAKKFLILDYEKSISKEKPRIEIIKKYLRKTKDGEAYIDGLDYSDAQINLDNLKEKEELTDEERKTIKDMEAFLNSITIEEERIVHQPTTDYLRDCGVLINELLIADPEDTEEGIEICRDMVESKEVDGIIWDSLQAALPKWVKERDADADTMGKEAKQNGLLLRHICSKFAAKDLKDPQEAYKAAVFITSQMRSNLSSFYGVDTYSGGHAVKHHMALALEFKRLMFISNDGNEATSKNGKEYFGQLIKLRAEKNKLAPPETKSETDYYFKSGEGCLIGLDHAKEILTIGVYLNIIDLAGAWYSVEGERLGQGKANAAAALRNPEFASRIYAKIKEKLN